MYFQRPYNPFSDDLSLILASAAPHLLISSIFNSPSAVTLFFGPPEAGLTPAARGPLVVGQLHSPQPERGVRT